MANVWGWVLIAGVALVVSAAVTGLWARHARHGPWLDQPGSRRLHVHPTPRGGGVGIFVLALLAMSVLALMNPAEQRYWWLSGLGLAVCAGAGLLDDLRRLPAWGKFGLQWLAALLLAAAGQSLTGGAGTWINSAGIVVFTLLLVNFTNFMDGSNGLVALQSVVLVLALAVTGATGPPLLLGWVLLAAALGFLPFNFPRARVFLGDVGSHALGYCLALLFIRSMGDGNLDIAQVFLLLSAVMMDAGLTLFQRIAGGKRFWLAHCEHLYQWALRAGVSPTRIALAYAAWTSLAAVLAWLINDGGDRIAAAGIMVLLATIIYVGLKWHWAGRLAQEHPA